MENKPNVQINHRCKKAQKEEKKKMNKRQKILELVKQYNKKIEDINEQKVVKGISIILFVLFLAALLPLLSLAPFDHSCADDYAYGNALHELVNSGSYSLIDIVKTVAENTYDYYKAWQGTYSSIFLMSLQPAVFGENTYIVVPFVMLGSIVFSIIVFIKEIIQRILGGKWYHTMAVSSVLLFMILEHISSPVEGFYWYNSAIHYTIMYSAMLLLIICFLRIYQEMKIQWIILSVLLEILVAGGNYLTLLLAFILESMFLLGMLLGYVGKSKAISKKQLVLTCGLYVVYLVLAVLNMIAPGNEKRKSLFAGLSVKDTIIQSFKSGILAMDYCLTIEIVILVLVLLPVIWNMLKKCKYNFPYPAVIIVFSFCVLSSMYAPLYFSFGLLAPPTRTINIIMITFYLLLILDVIYLCGWIQKNIFHKENENGKQYFYYSISLLIILCGYFTFTNKDNFNSYSAIKSLVSGEAKAYHEQVEARLKLLENDQVSEVVLEPFTVKPKLLFMDDIAEDSSDFKNYTMATYYGKVAVRLKSEK